ncbi:MAG: molybdopterin-binding protein [Firmicutes bacterium]|nr:molybdopterin-binding protein [Bacillota bacterium]
MKKIDTKNAVGHVLCHDITRIVKDSFKGPQFRKGHIITEDDIPMLLSMGKDHVFVWEKKEGFLHEDEAAERLRDICFNENMSASAPKEGKIEIKSEIDGLFVIDTEKLFAINMLDEIMIASRHSMSAVKKGDKLIGTRVIPLVIDGKKLDEAEKIAGEGPIAQVIPYKIKKAAVITTGNEVASGRIKDDFTPVIIEKLSLFGVEVVSHVITDDGIENIKNALDNMRKTDAELILCTGGMSVDPDDNTPGAIKESGAEIVTYGAPVLPGAMFLLGYYEGGLPVMGLPGCVMYADTTIFDIILPRILAGVKVDKKDIAVLGNGGLCLGCDECRYPVCPFGK